MVPRLMGYNPDKRIGTTTFGELQKMKAFADAQLQRQKLEKAKQQAEMMSMQGSIMPGNQGMNMFMNILGKLVPNDVQQTNNSNNTGTSQGASGTGNTASAQPAANRSSASAPMISNNNSEVYSGLAQGVDTGNISSAYDMSGLNSISQKLTTSPNITIEDLESMQNEVSMSKVDIAERLATAQADFSNIQSQKSTAESNVTRLEGEVNTAETQKESAQKTLETDKSNMNSSVKARDQLDEQLASVNDEYKAKCDTVKQEESAKAEAQQDVSNAKTSVAQAQSGVTMATQQLSSAEATLASTPETINGVPNPAYATAKAAVESAKVQKEQAEKELETAEKSLQEAETKLQAAEERLTTAQDAKEQTLQNLQQTDSKYKDMAKKCEQMQKQVENAQETYDTSLETFDNTSANYERLNTELQSQQGILNQLEVYQTKLDNIQAASDKVTQLEEQINQKLQAKNQMTNEMLENANATEGCSASKTPAENLISMKDGQQKLDRFAYTSKMHTTKAGLTFFDVSQMKVQDTAEVINEDASYFEKSGCLANADGSYTNPENGVTWIDVGGGTWARTDTLYKHQEYMNIAKEKYPETVEALRRAQDQLPDYGIVGLTANSNLRKFMPNWNKMH